MTDKQYTRLAIIGIIVRLLIALGILALIGLIFWITRDIHCLWGLIALISIIWVPTYSSKPAHIKTRCPICHSPFVAVQEDEEINNENEEVTENAS